MKRVFYFTDALPFMAREDAAIDKLLRNLKIFREASDNIQLVWHPWSETEKYFEINKSGAADKYKEIVEKYKKESWGVLDESKDFESAKTVLLTCDAYYGDTSDLVYEAQNAKMPVMLQNFDV